MFPPYAAGNAIFTECDLDVTGRGVHAEWTNNAGQEWYLDLHWQSFDDVAAAEGFGAEGVFRPRFFLSVIWNTHLTYYIKMNDDWMMNDPNHNAIEKMTNE